MVIVLAKQDGLTTYGVDVHEGYVHKPTALAFWRGLTLGQAIGLISQLTTANLGSWK